MGIETNNHTINSYSITFKPQRNKEQSIKNMERLRKRLMEAEKKYEKVAGATV
jgi:hypothetical protein